MLSVTCAAWALHWSPHITCIKLFIGCKESQVHIQLSRSSFVSLWPPQREVHSTPASWDPQNDSCPFFFLTAGENTLKEQSHTTAKRPSQVVWLPTELKTLHALQVAQSPGNYSRQLGKKTDISIFRDNADRTEGHIWEARRLVYGTPCSCLLHTLTHYSTMYLFYIQVPRTQLVFYETWPVISMWNIGCCTRSL